MFHSSHWSFTAHIHFGPILKLTYYLGLRANLRADKKTDSLAHRSVHVKSFVTERRVSCFSLRFYFAYIRELRTFALHCAAPRCMSNGFWQLVVNLTTCACGLFWACSGECCQLQVPATQSHWSVVHYDIISWNLKFIMIHTLVLRIPVTWNLSYLSDTVYVLRSAKGLKMAAWDGWTSRMDVENYPRHERLALTFVTKLLNADGFHIRANECYLFDHCLRRKDTILANWILTREWTNSVVDRRFSAASDLK